MGDYEPEEPEGQFDIQVPPDLEVGVYSNFLSVWHSPYEFTLDFSQTQPPEPVDPVDPESLVRVPCRVVARVKIPTTLIFAVLQALNGNMTQYENSFGSIQRPGEEQEGGQQ